jgi:MFS family permease
MDGLSIDPNARPAVYSSTTQEVLAAIALTAAPAMHAMSMGALQMGLPKIAEDFGVSGGEVTWLLSAYTLTSGSFLLLFGRVSDLIGRKKVLIASFIWFALCSLVCGFMKNFIAFCVLRGLQGLGMVILRRKTVVDRC